MKCVKCENDKFFHLIFVLQCNKCGEVNMLPESDNSGTDFLVQRYVNPTENNRPGTDIEFEVKEVSKK